MGIQPNTVRRIFAHLESGSGDRIIEIGCVELVNRRLTGNKLHFYVNPERRSHEDAIKVHGLSEDFLADKPLFAHVADDVQWTVMGTHPLAGEYHSKADFRAHTFARLNTVLREGILLRVTHVIAHGEWAVVELQALSTALNGKPFDNRYCWVIRFDGEFIVEVRAYLDSALVQKLIDGNEG